MHSVSASDRIPFIGWPVCVCFFFIQYFGLLANAETWSPSSRTNQSGTHDTHGASNHWVPYQTSKNQHEYVRCVIYTHPLSAQMRIECDFHTAIDGRLCVDVHVVYGAFENIDLVRSFALESTSISSLMRTFSIRLEIVRTCS